MFAVSAFGRSCWADRLPAEPLDMLQRPARLLSARDGAQPQGGWHSPSPPMFTGHLSCPEASTGASRNLVKGAVWEPVSASAGQVPRDVVTAGTGHGEQGAERGTDTGTGHREQGEQGMDTGTGHRNGARTSHRSPEGPAGAGVQECEGGHGEALVMRRERQLSPVQGHQAGPVAVTLERAPGRREGEAATH